MAISGQQVIAVGLQNEAEGSDSLYTAFNKTVDNFATLFACASPYNTFTGNVGISTTANATSGVVTITNTGVTSIVAGTNITISQANGAVTISSSGGGNGGGGGVSSVGVNSSTLTVTNSPIVSAGNIVVNLPATGITPGTYTNPTVAVDSYGRVTTISNNTVAGTVTSVGITPGSGILVTNSPITSSGAITVTNTGVTSVAAGTGISVSGSNGNVTISTTASGGTVTSVTVSSNTLTVTGGTITTSGVITVNLPSNISVTGNITGGNLVTGGSISATGNANVGNIGATIGVFIGISGSLITGNQANITTVGTLANLSVSGNSNVGNIGATEGRFISIAG
jgi:fibronectin-binding autotransporter adhesin